MLIFQPYMFPLAKLVVFLSSQVAKNAPGILHEQRILQTDTGKVSRVFREGCADLPQSRNINHNKSSQNLGQGQLLFDTPYTIPQDVVKFCQTILQKIHVSRLERIHCLCESNSQIFVQSYNFLPFCFVGGMIFSRCKKMKKVQWNSRTTKLYFYNEKCLI